MSLALKKDPRVSLSVDFQSPVSNIFGKSHAKPIRFDKPKMILLSEQKKLNPVHFTVKTQVRYPHKFLLNDEDQTPIRFDQSQRILKPLSLVPKSVKNINFNRKPSPKKESDYLKISEIINVNSVLYNNHHNSTKFSNQSPSPISFLESRFSPDLRLEKNNNYAEIDLPRSHKLHFSRHGGMKSTATSLINNSKMLLKELNGDESSGNNNNRMTPKKSLEKLGLILNLAKQNKRKDQFELMSASKEYSCHDDLSINLTKSHNLNRRRKVGHRLVHKQGLKVQGLKSLDSLSKEIVVTSPY